MPPYRRRCGRRTPPKTHTSTRKLSGITIDSISNRSHWVWWFTCAIAAHRRPAGADGDPVAVVCELVRNSSRRRTFWPPLSPAGEGRDDQDPIWRPRSPAAATRRAAISTPWETCSELLELVDDVGAHRAGRACVRVEGVGAAQDEQLHVALPKLVDERVRGAR